MPTTSPEIQSYNPSPCNQLHVELPSPVTSPKVISDSTTIATSPFTAEDFPPLISVSVPFSSQSPIKLSTAMSGECRGRTT